MLCPLCDGPLPIGVAWCPRCTAIEPRRMDELPAPREGGTLHWLGNAVGMMRLDPRAVEAFASDPRATTTAWLIALLAGPGANVVWSPDPTALVLQVGLYTLALLPAIGFLHVICKGLGGQATYPQFLRTMLATQMVYAVCYIPVLGPALLLPAFMWDLIVTTYTTAVVQKISGTRALAALFLTCLALGLLALL